MFSSKYFLSFLIAALILTTSLPSMLVSAQPLPINDSSNSLLKWNAFNLTNYFQCSFKYYSLMYQMNDLVERKAEKANYYSGIWQDLIIKNEVLMKTEQLDKAQELAYSIPKIESLREKSLKMYSLNTNLLTIATVEARSRPCSLSRIESLEVRMDNSITDIGKIEVVTESVIKKAYVIISQSVPLEAASEATPITTSSDSSPNQISDKTNSYINNSRSQAQTVTNSLPSTSSTSQNKSSNQSSTTTSSSSSKTTANSSSLTSIPQSSSATSTSKSQSSKSSTGVWSSSKSSLSMRSSSPDYEPSNDESSTSNSSNSIYLPPPTSKISSSSSSTPAIVNSNTSAAPQSSPNK